MTDLYSDYSNNKGNPQLDKDYWKNQNNNADKQENYNIFDTMVQTNFGKGLDDLSVFKSRR